MTSLEEVRIGVRSLERFEKILGPAETKRALTVARRVRDLLQKRVVWNVNSTAVGGGVAEMLQSLLCYTRSAGIDTRWMVISGNPDFFRVTKRLHHALHGSAGDGSPLDEEAHRIYEKTLEENALELASVVRPGDVVLLHDPQTAGLAPALRNSGAHLVWRCHIGTDAPNEESEIGWEFLRRYLETIPLFVFTQRAYVPDVCDHGKATIITPSIDAFSPKNQDLSEDKIRTFLVHTGLVEGPPPEKADHSFVRDDGTPGRVERRAEVVRFGRPPSWDTPLVVQVSRWDPLKDMAGVMEGFKLLCSGGDGAGAELVLAGPDVSGVTDDPEGLHVFEQTLEAWRALPAGVRDRVHLVSLPVDDIQENAAIVNALQRHAAIVVQKSLREGFGLTVTEAMWKERPLVASAVGGIVDQIEDGVSGVLLKDPSDLPAFAKTLDALLRSPEQRQKLGRAARERVRDHFLGVGHLLKYAKLLERLEEVSD